MPSGEEQKNKLNNGRWPNKLKIKPRVRQRGGHWFARTVTIGTTRGQKKKKGHLFRKRPLGESGPVRSVPGCTYLAPASKNAGGGNPAMERVEAQLKKKELSHKTKTWRKNTSQPGAAKLDSRRGVMYGGRKMEPAKEDQK